jgi:hypothetical protein
VRGFTRIARGRGVPFLCSLAVAGAALAGVLFVGVSSASAYPSNCPSKSWCLYSGTNFSGGFWAFDQATSGSDHWIGLTTIGEEAESLYNNRAHVTYLGECVSGYCSDPPRPNGKDCQIPGGERGDLHNYSYPDGFTEWHDIGYFDLSYSGTTC